LRSAAIKSYMMGEAPPAFDLLFWNGDGTNLPGRMAVQYLRELCQSDAFATQGITLLGSKKKYGHFTNQDLTLSSDQWQKTADFNSGSWWPSWSAWLTRRSGKKIAARHFSEAERENLPDAPGRYVRL